MGHLGATRSLVTSEILQSCTNVVLLKPTTKLTFAIGKKESSLQWPVTEVTRCRQLYSYRLALDTSSGQAERKDPEPSQHTPLHSTSFWCVCGR